MDIGVKIVRRICRIVDSKPGATMFYVAFGVAFFKLFLNSTMFPAAIVDAGILNLLSYGCLALICLIAAINILRLLVEYYIAEDKKQNLLNLAVLGFGIGAGVLCLIFGHYREPFILFCVVAAAWRKRVEPIFVISLVLGSVIMIAAYVASMNGYALYLTYDMGKDMLGHAFGMNYRTDFAAHVMYLVMMYAALRAEKLKPWEYIMLWFDTWVVWRYSSAKIASACMAAFLTAFGLLIAFRYVKHRWPRIPKWTALIHIVCFLFTMLMIAIYPSDGKQDTYSMRIDLSRRGFETYSTTFFGQRVAENGLGGIYDVSDGYFFLDIMYVRMLILYGIVVTIVFLAMMTLASYRAIGSGQAVLVLALFIVAVDSLVEHHAMEIWYNVFVLLCATEVANLHVNSSLIEKVDADNAS